MNMIATLAHPLLLLPTSFLFGLMVGSFLNVCICRLPVQKSIVTPPSSCTHCQKPIKAYDNIPLLSFVILRGRCRYCGGAVSWQYPAVELITGLLFLGLAYRWGLSVQTFVYALLVCILLVVSVIDLQHQIIPDKITLPGMILGLGLSLFSLLPVDLVQSLIGLTVGGGILYAVAIVSRGGMGGGDIKLMALLGIFLGWQKVLLTIFLGVLLGSAVGIALMLLKSKGRKDKIPFGPFLGLGALISIFFGQEIIDWYLFISGLCG